MAAPLIHTANEMLSPRKYEALPPWLLSMLVHMIAVISLGMFHFGLNPGNELQLVFSPEESLSIRETQFEGLSELEIAIGNEILELASVEDTPAPISPQELLTSLETDWADVISKEGGEESLVNGFGDAALLAGGGTKLDGGKATTSLFGLAGEGGKFVYVFDRSASMLSSYTLYSEDQLINTITPLECAKTELIRSLSALGKQHQFQIVFYNHAPWVYGQSHYADELYTANDRNKEEAIEFIENMPAAGFTNHLSALEAAIMLEPDVIFLLTDGEDKDDLHPNVVRRMAKFCQKQSVVVNVVHFSNVDRPECTLIPLAENTGGKHIFLTLESLARIMVQPMAMR